MTFTSLELAQKVGGVLIGSERVVVTGIGAVSPNGIGREAFWEATRNGISGTLVRDVIEYELGLGPLEALVNSFFIEPKMRTMFAQRQKALPDLLR